MPLGLGLGISKIKSLVSGLRVRFQGNATITAALDGILRDLSADFVSNGTVTAALEAIKLLDVDFSGDGTLTGDLADYAYLLDDYSGAAAAYSLRLLSSTYSGSAIRVRRSSDNAEQDIGFVDNVLDTASLLSFVGANDGFVRTWYDQSGNTGRDLTQATAANQPKIVNAGSVITENSKPAVQPVAGQNMSILGTFLSSNSTTFQVDTRGNSTSSYYIPNRGNNNSRYYWINQSGSTTTGLSSNSGTPTFYVNGVLFTGSTRGDAYTFDTGHQRILTATSLNLSSWNGYDLMYGVGDDVMSFFQERILYDSDQSSNRTGIETNINDFYSIY